MPKKKQEECTTQHKHTKTRKARKVTLCTKSIHKRITHAKKIKERAKHLPLNELRELLISKKLIKKDSKAPESVLRQIHADAEIISKSSKAL